MAIARLDKGGHVPKAVFWNLVPWRQTRREGANPVLLARTGEAGRRSIKEVIPSMNVRKTVALGLVAQVVLLFVAGLLGLVPGLGPQVATAASLRHFSLLAETMQPIDSSIGYDNTMAFLTTTQDSSISPPASYIGQLDLPDGARIVSVLCFGLDTDPSAQFEFQLFRYNLYNDPVWSPVSDWTMSGVPFTGGKFQIESQVDPDAALVDNARYSYGMYLVLPKATSGALGVLRFVVDTTLYSAGIPLVQRNASSR